MVKTLKSRCIEFKIFFSNLERNKILMNLLEYHHLNIENKSLNEMINFYNSPGTVINLINLINSNSIKSESINLRSLIFQLMEINLKNKSNYNLFLMQNLIELFYLKRIKDSNNKGKFLFNYSQVLRKLDYFRRYNIDMNNTFYEIKENIIHA